MWVYIDPVLVSERGASFYLVFTTTVHCGSYSVHAHARVGSQAIKTLTLHMHSQFACARVAAVLNHE